MGELMLAATSKSSSGTNLLPIIVIVVLFMLVYMMFTRRNRARQAAQRQNAVVPGTRVRTTSGMYGTVTSVEGNNDVMMEVAPGVHIRVMRQAIVPLPDPGNTDTAGPADASGTTGNTANGSEPAPEPTAEGVGSDGSHADEWNPQDKNA